MVKVELEQAERRAYVLHHLRLSLSCKGLRRNPLRFPHLGARSPFRRPFDHTQPGPLTTNKPLEAQAPRERPCGTPPRHSAPLRVLSGSLARVGPHSHRMHPLNRREAHCSTRFSLGCGLDHRRTGAYHSTNGATGSQVACGCPNPARAAARSRSGRASSPTASGPRGTIRAMAAGSQPRPPRPTPSAPRTPRTGPCCFAGDEGSISRSQSLSQYQLWFVGT